MTELVIDVEGLVKEFDGKRVVNEVDLSIPKGQVWGFLGPNGSGKTTTIRMICGLLTPTQGQGKCLGFDIVTEAEKVKTQTGYMTQKFSFWEDLTIRENLQFVARIYNLSNKRQVIDATLQKLGLQNRQHQLAGALSGGWKQRLALAAVTMHKPKLLLLDEPTAGVDPQARREFWDEIHFLSNQGITVLVSTHYMDEAERCDQIAYLAHGNLITKGSVADVIARSNLVTFSATGDNSRQALTELKKQPAIENAAYFGSALHISGTDQAGMEAITQHANFDKLKWQRIEPNLEDVFISLMKNTASDQRKF
ncbi:ABC transporter ATP-binding protein [Aliiglaciecola sp. LCG003]|uniref:ABC transporter ATP-binding protein n=1 Tax=Aliiglaciecola sp. LCG003 TaxID=3053655 RepID=UPI002572EE51|nr:ABC transporter ATP-binding protein [Aliiglaciecola sp. LCG003]WJG10715.1 ABC transporter ATP-binding protein [Aliiglaciecola sp. LCG003]